MNAGLMKRILLALIPVALLSTASLALTSLNHPVVTTTPVAVNAASAVEPAPFVPMKLKVPSNIVAQAPPAPQPPQQQPAQPEQTTTDVTQQPPAEEVVAAEPLPELVVDKASLEQAMAQLDLALEQAKLSVTAIDGKSQRTYIQETINLLAGAEDTAFRLRAGASAETYAGVRPLLIQARVTREAAEVQWIAAVQAQVEATQRRMAETAQASAPEGTVAPPPAPTFDLSATVGQAGVLGTRGMRPEEQAMELISQAIKHSITAMSAGSDDAAEQMQFVVRRLEAAKKVIQIALDR
jgi:hypothetical protein